MAAMLRVSAVEPSDFLNPPDSAKATGYWWWFNGRMDQAGITRDLEEFKAKGLGGVMMVSSSSGGYRWGSPVEVDYRVAGNELELAVPRAALGIAPGQPAFDFKWADNIQQTGDWSDLTVNGNAAPNDRYNFRAIFSRPAGE